MRSVLDSVAEGLTDAVLKGSGGGGGLAGTIAGIFGGRGYAAGTMSSRAGWAMVGERGPEMVKLPGGSHVMSNAQLRNVGMGSKAAGGTTITIDNRGAVIWEKAAQQMMSYADRAAAAAGVGSVQVSRTATPADLARQGGRRLGR
jgi:SLT domain-containing protein